MTTPSPRAGWSTNRYTFAILRHHGFIFGMATLCFGFFYSLPLLHGLVVKLIFDSLETSQGTTIWLYALAFAVVSYGRVGILWIGDYFFASLWYRVKLFLQRNVLDYLLNARGSRIINETSGESIARFRDDVDEIMLYVEDWIDVLGVLLYAGIAISIMLRIAPTMTLVMLLPLLVIVIIAQALAPLIRRFRERSRSATEGVTNFIGELFSAVQSVRVAGKEASTLQHFAQLNETRRQAALKDTLLVELLRGVNQNMVNIATGLVLLLAAQRISSGSFSVGDFALFLAYLPRLTNIMAFFGDMISVHKRAGVSFARLNQLLTDAPAAQLVRNVPLLLHRDRQHYPHLLSQQSQRYSPVLADYDAISHTPLRTLRVEGLSYQHRNPSDASASKGIDAISFRLEAGQFVVITGRVGAGKSTLVKVLLGLLPKDSGTIYWNEQPVDDPAAFFTPPRSAYTAQHPRLVSDSLQRNIALGQSHDGLGQSLRLAVMEHDVARLEHGLETRVGSRGVKLSGGQIQRSAAARMFMQQAQLLVFDDMSSALDVHTEQQLWQGIFAEARAAGKEVSCLVVSHRKAALERADTILLMEDGRIIDRGTLHELLARSQAMRKLWDGES